LEKSRAELQTKLNDGFDPRMPVNVTFGEVLDRYLNDPILKVKQKPSFKRNIKQKLENLRKEFRSLRINALTKKVVANWFTNREKKVVDARDREVVTNAWNQLDYKGHLDRIFRFAMKKKLAKHNPIQDILEEEPDFFPAPPEGRIVELTDEELKAVMDALDYFVKNPIRSMVSPQLFKDIFIFRLFQGTRIQEALDIQIKDVTKKDVKGECRAFVFIKPGKTGHGRTIPVMKMVEEVVERNMKSKNTEDFLFSLGKKHLKTCQLRRMFCKILALARDLSPNLMNKRLTFYDTRHICLTRLALKGMGDRLLGSFAGHRSRRSTDIYVNFSQEHLIEAVKAVESDFARTMTKA
jgi:integrase